MTAAAGPARPSKPARAGRNQDGSQGKRSAQGLGRLREALMEALGVWEAVGKVGEREQRGQGFGRWS